MTAAHQFGFAHPPRESRWPSVVVSVALTLATFAAAFTAMRRVPRWIASPADRDAAVTVHFQPPVPVPARRLPRPPLAAPVTPPPSVAPVPDQRTTPASPAAPLASEKPTPNAVRADSGLSADRAAVQPSTAATAAPAARLGAPMSPSGISRIIAPPDVQARRAAAADSLRAAVFAAMWKAPPSAAMKKEVDDSNRDAAAVARRATTAGNSADVHIVQGNGYGGAGAATGALSLGSGSFGLPFLSKGPSAAQRRKNDSLDADYRARLARLQELVRQRGDSARADSLRRDSVARLRRP